MITLKPVISCLINNSEYFYDLNMKSIFIVISTPIKVVRLLNDHLNRILSNFVTLE